MDNWKFVKLAKKAVVDYFNSHKEITDEGRLTPEDVYVVWLCKTIQNKKALLSTTVRNDMYYETKNKEEKNKM